MVKIKLSNLLDVLRPGDIIATCDSSIVSKVIQGVTNSEVSHICIVTSVNPNGAFCIWESIMEGGVRRTCITNMFFKVERGAAMYWYPLKRRLTKDQCKQITQRAEEMDTAGYSWTKAAFSVMDRAINGVMGWLGYEPDNKPNTKNVFCSEFACILLQHVGVVHHDASCRMVTPQELLEMEIFKIPSQIIV